MIENLDRFSFELYGGENNDSVQESVVIDQQKLSELLHEAAEPGTPGGHSSCEVIHKKNDGIVCARCKYDSDGDEIVGTIHGNC
jgi:hypothetical protein